jgi:erythromycin esterase-like protein
MRSPDALAAARYHAFVSMGERAARALGHDAYVIAFTAYAGSAGSGPSSRPLDRAGPGSLEARWHALGRPALFVDLGGAGGEGGEAYFLGLAPLEGRWGEVFDGAVFLDRMEAVRAVAR